MKNSINKLIIGLLILIMMNIPVEAQNKDLPYIAKWYNNKKAAVSLRFDDGLESHVKFVIPTLNKYGIPGTFMVNPERTSLISGYKSNREFWEKEVPKMRHKLGNHTMNHVGAENLEQAEYEIGEVAKLIWRLYPDDSKLHVFASGGGEYWGGKRWHEADSSYKKLVDKYHMIDLYDGNHPAIGAVNSRIATGKGLCEHIDSTITGRSHLQIAFHQVGSPRLIDYIKGIISDDDLELQRIRIYSTNGMYGKP